MKIKFSFGKHYLPLMWEWRVNGGIFEWLHWRGDCGAADCVLFLRTKI